MSSRLVLYTHWAEDYWEQPRETRYPNRSYKELIHRPTYFFI